jgi:hypothetical protein
MMDNKNMTQDKKKHLYSLQSRKGVISNYTDVQKYVEEFVFKEDDPDKKPDARLERERMARNKRIRQNLWLDPVAHARILGHVSLDQLFPWLHRPSVEYTERGAVVATPDGGTCFRMALVPELAEGEAMFKKATKDRYDFGRGTKPVDRADLRKGGTALQGAVMGIADMVRGVPIGEMDDRLRKHIRDRVHDYMEQLGMLRERRHYVGTGRHINWSDINERGIGEVSDMMYHDYIWERRQSIAETSSRNGVPLSCIMDFRRALSRHRRGLPHGGTLMGDVLGTVLSMV